MKRSEEIFVFLEFDYKDYGIKFRIRMSKYMSVTRESEVSSGVVRFGIKFFKTMFFIREFEWVDVD